MLAAHIIKPVMVSQVIGTGVSLPKQVVTNQWLSTRLGLSEKEIKKRCGIETRHWVREGETTSTLAIEAAKAALQAASLPPRAIDLILVSTTSPDMIFPSTACLVQKGLSARSIPALDISASCAGFLYALSVGDQFIKTKSARNVLIVAAEVKSPFIDLTDPATAILFGDGAGAVVLTNGMRGVRSVRLYSDGARHRLIHLPAGGSRVPMTDDSLRRGLHTIKMEGRGLFRMAVEKMERSLRALSNEVALSDIDLFIFHQANLRILELILKRTGIPPEKCHRTIGQVGNTSSSSIPIALNDAICHGKLKKGDRLALCAFGGGLTWGWAVIEW